VLLEFVEEVDPWFEGIRCMCLNLVLMIPILTSGFSTISGYLS
jgi:hypothetical protein